ncbi:MAG: RpiB/LacA/LacB family sugar-phosphate isomerase, partial [Anaerolineales bacterium]|nr:RpiB/LacA/LacB family sugar-phosphate isomerase [Anaerolineales bacterium]
MPFSAVAWAWTDRGGYGIRRGIVWENAGTKRTKTMRIIVGADHAGFTLKEMLREELLAAGHEVIDVGAYSYE